MILSDEESCAPTEPEGDGFEATQQDSTLQPELDEQLQGGAPKMTAVKTGPAKPPAGVSVPASTPVALETQMAELADLKAKYEALLAKVEADQRKQSPAVERPLFTPSPKIAASAPPVGKAPAVIKTLAPEVVPVIPSPTCAPAATRTPPPAATPTSVALKGRTSTDSVAGASPTPTSVASASGAARPTSADGTSTDSVAGASPTSVASGAARPTSADALRPGEEELAEQFNMNHKDFKF